MIIARDRPANRREESWLPKRDRLRFSVRRSRVQHLGSRYFGGLAIGLCAVLGFAGCGGTRSDRGAPPVASATPEPMAPESPTAAAILSTIRTRSGAPLPAGLADGFKPVVGGLRARFASR